MTQGRRICGSVDIDTSSYDLRLEGISFPFYIRDVPEVEIEERGMVGLVTITILADNIRITSDHPRDRLTVADHAWIDSTLNNILEEKLGDTLAWLRATGHSV